MKMNGYITFILLLIALCACKKPGAPAITNRPLESTEWVLMAIDSFKNPASASGEVLSIHMAAGSDLMHGFDGCNHFNGKYKVEETHLILTNLFGTQLACPETKLPARFIQLLTGADRFKIQGEMLYFYEGKKVILEFIAH